MRCKTKPFLKRLGFERLEQRRLMAADSPLSDVNGDFVKSEFLAQAGASEIAPQVQMRVHSTDMNGQPISEVRRGDLLNVHVSVQDLRPVGEQRGVFLATVDLLFSPSLQLVGELQFDNAAYRSHRDGVVTEESIDQISVMADNLGFSDPASGLAEQLLFRATFVAEGTEGVARVDARPSNTPEALLVFGQDFAVPGSAIGTADLEVSFAALDPGEQSTNNALIPAPHFLGINRPSPLESPTGLSEPMRDRYPLFRSLQLDELVLGRLFEDLERRFYDEVTLDRVTEPLEPLAELESQSPNTPRSRRLGESDGRPWYRWSLDRDDPLAPSAKLTDPSLVDLLFWDDRYLLEGWLLPPVQSRFRVQARMYAWPESVGDEDDQSKPMEKEAQECRQTCSGPMVDIAILLRRETPSAHLDNVIASHSDDVQLDAPQNDQMPLPWRMNSREISVTPIAE
ncbi:MAG: hypothetical protein AAGA03_03720 [Planctomycetota bacterium]